MPIDVSLLDKLATEADLNDVLNLDQNIPIEDALIPSDDITATNIEPLQILAENRPAAAVENTNGSETNLDNYTSTSSTMLPPSSTRMSESNSSEHNEDEDVSTEDVCSSLWLQLISTMKKFDHKDLQNASICEMYPAEDCEDPSDNTWRRIVLRKSKKHKWEILDESGTELLEEVTADDDNGPIAEWNMYYRRPTISSIAEARKEYDHIHGHSSNQSNDIMETPRRKRSRSRAHEHQIAQARGMKKRAKKLRGLLRWDQ